MGMPLESYKKDQLLEKERYKKALEQQYMDSLARKTKSKLDTEPAEPTTLLDAETEQEKKVQEVEELRKKQFLKEEYVKSLEIRDKSKKEEENKKLAEVNKRLEECGRIKAVAEVERHREKERQKKLGDVLAIQVDMSKSRKDKEKTERYEWMDDRSKKHIQDIEQRVDRLKEEILKYIRTNAASGKAKKEEKVVNPLS